MQLSKHNRLIMQRPQNKKACKWENITVLQQNIVDLPTSAGVKNHEQKTWNRGSSATRLFCSDFCAKIKAL